MEKKCMKIARNITKYLSNIVWCVMKLKFYTCVPVAERERERVCDITRYLDR